MFPEHGLECTRYTSHVGKKLRCERKKLSFLHQGTRKCHIENLSQVSPKIFFRHFLKQ